MTNVDKIIIITKQTDTDSFIRDWGVQKLPAFLDKDGGEPNNAGGAWAVALGNWEARAGWEKRWCAHPTNAAILIHPGGGGRTLVQADIQGSAGIRQSFKSRVFTWSSGGSAGQRALGDILADLAGWRKTGNAVYFERGVKLLKKALAQAADNSALKTEEEARSGKAAEIFNSGREAAGLPERGPPPDPLSVLIHDTLGAIDPFVLDVRNLLEGYCEFGEFKAYWKGKAATGVRRLRAWLGQRSTAASEEEWLKRSRLGQYPPSDEGKKRIGEAVEKMPEILEKADTGNWAPESDEETSETKPTEVTVNKLRSCFKELDSWFNSLRDTLKKLRDASRG